MFCNHNINNNNPYSRYNKSYNLSSCNNLYRTCYMTSNLKSYLWLDSWLCLIACMNQENSQLRSLGCNMSILLMWANNPYSLLICIGFSTCWMMCCILKIMLRMLSMCYYSHIRSSLLYCMGWYHSMHKTVWSKDSTQLCMSDTYINQILSILSTLQLNSFEDIIYLRSMYSQLCMMYMRFYYVLCSLLCQRMLNKPFLMSCNSCLQCIQYMWLFQRHNWCSLILHWCSWHNMCLLLSSK